MKLKNIFIVLAMIALSSCASNSLDNQTPNQKKADVYYGQGTSELINKDYMKALQNLTKAKDLDPKNSKIRNNLGMAYFFRDQIKLAETELAEAISLDDKNSDARLNLGNILLNQKRNKEAKALFLKVEKDLTFTNQFRNYFNLSLIALAEGDRRLATEYLNKSIKEKEDYCTAHYSLGEIYLEEYRFEQALEAFRNASKGTCVNEPAPHYQQAIVLINMNKEFEAKRKFNEIKEKFASTRYGALATIQLNKLETNYKQSTNRSNLTERVDNSSSIIESPQF